MPSNCRGPVVLTISDKQDMTIQGWALRMHVQSWWTDNVIMAWAAEQTCWIVTHFLMLGFQLDLYAPSEYCMLYWYLPSASLRPKNRVSFCSLSCINCRLVTERPVLIFSLWFAYKYRTLHASVPSFTHIGWLQCGFLLLYNATLESGWGWDSCWASAFDGSNSV